MSSLTTPTKGANPAEKAAGDRRRNGPTTAITSPRACVTR